MQRDRNIWSKKKCRNSDWLMVEKGHYVDFHQGREEPQRAKTGMLNYS